MEENKSNKTKKKIQWNTKINFTIFGCKKKFKQKKIILNLKQIKRLI